MARKLWEIAQDIRFEWGSNLAHCAKPYLEAMADLETIDDRYHADSARMVVEYFLANAGGWRGEKARELKRELKAILQGKG